MPRWIPRDVDVPVGCYSYKSVGQIISTDNHHRYANVSDDVVVQVEMSAVGMGLHVVAAATTDSANKQQVCRLFLLSAKLLTALQCRVIFPYVCPDVSPMALR